MIDPENIVLQQGDYGCGGFLMADGTFMATTSCSVTPKVHHAVMFSKDEVREIYDTLTKMYEEED